MKERIYYEKVFTKCDEKNWRNISLKERRILKRRKVILNEDFNFNEVALAKIQALSNMLKENESIVKKQVDEIMQRQVLAKNAHSFDDYEVEVHIHLFNHDDFKKSNDSGDIYQFYSDRYIMLYNGVGDEFFQDNWNEFQFMNNHPLQNQFHCYTLHHLYDHTILSWSDILRIDEVWIEIHTINQYFLTLKS